LNGVWFFKRSERKMPSDEELLGITSGIPRLPEQIMTHLMA
jgi:hypothetical protein